MSEDLRLGRIIDMEARVDRDAIHIAVIPARAAEELQPGQHVGFSENGYLVTGAPQQPRECIGIVDPYLRRAVNARERFWLFLYPNTVTSLRHKWQHPAISDNGVGVASPSEAWLRNFADEVGADYHQMMHVAATHCEGAKQSWPDYLIEGGRWEGQSTPTEFWDHYERVTGKKPADNEKPGIFSCSC